MNTKLILTLAIVGLMMFAAFQTTDTACACQHINAPVCASDGKTYANACTVGCKGLEVVSQGACPGDPTQAPLFPGGK